LRFFRRTLQRANLSRKVKCLLAIAIIALGWSASAVAQTFNIFPISNIQDAPYLITAGPDGNLWFTESSCTIGRITTAGVITEFTIRPNSSGPCGPLAITAGPDGALWFTESDGNKIGRITTAGVVTNEFSIPTANSSPAGITAGPDGALWFTETANSTSYENIGRITTDGVFTEYQVPTESSGPSSITAGPDGNLWFTEQSASQIGRITITGTITEFMLSPNQFGSAITLGPDGALWFGLDGDAGRITTAGVITEFPIPCTNAGGITTGRDGALWYQCSASNGSIARITTTGTYVIFPIPVANSNAHGVATGSDGATWVALNGGTGNIARLSPTLTLSAGVSGSGTVTSTPSGISCGSTCSASFGSGTQVTLNETPASGWVFSGWSGACSGAGSCVVTMSAAESVTAAFLIAQGGLTRTFVSSAGVDTNPCTVTAPCATFAQAYTLTQPTGIIAALDPGKYGPLTITYPVTVNGNGWAAITGTAQGNGITVNADVGNVILTGLEVDGAGAAYNGIVFNSGASLTVSNCIVKDFISNNSVTGNGIMIAPTSGAVDFTIVNTVALNNASAGIHYLPATGSAAAIGAIDHIIAANNAIGIAVDLSATSGGSAAVTISNSTANNNTSDGVVAASTGDTVTVTADHDEISSNGTGVSIGANTSVLLSRSVIAENSTYGISNSGIAASSQDNRIAGNGNGNVVHGTALTPVAQQ
jgi:virginiamycin B lyase